MKYFFKKFDGVYSRGEAKISLNSDSIIRFTSAFCRSTGISNFKFTVLFFDETNKAIAFKFTNSREEGVLRITGDRSGMTVAARSFMRANNLTLKNYSGMYDYKEKILPDVGRVYIIELKNK